MRTSKMKRTGWWLGAGLGALLLCGLTQELRAATATNAQASGSTDYWTNNAAWAAASYPGSAAGESAYLITNMAGSVTTLLDATLPGALTTLTLSNASGEVWLVVTNAALTNVTLNVRTGGRLQIANGGLVTNTSTLNIGGNGGRVNVNGGGSLFSAGTILGGGASNSLVSIGDESGLQALWNLRGGTLALGSGTATGNVLRIGGGGVLSNAVMLFNSPIVANNNSMIVENGGQVFAGLTVGDGSAGSYVTNPAVIMPDGSLWEPGSSGWNGGGKAFTIGGTLSSTGNYACINGRTFANFGALTIGYNKYPVGNALVITNGGKLYAGAANHGIGRSAGGGGSDQADRNVLSLHGNSLFDGGGYGMDVGSGVYNGDDADANILWVDSSVVTNVSRIIVALNSGIGNAMVVTNGGRIHTTGSAISYLASGAQGLSTNNALTIVGGAGVASRWDNGGAQFIVGGSSWGWYNILTIDGRGTYGSAVLTNMNGGGGAGFNVGNYGNAVVLTNGGVIQGVTGSSAVTVGKSNRVEITTGSRLEFNASSSCQFTMSGSDSLVLISGANSILAGIAPGANGSHLIVGNGAGADRNILRVEDSGVVTGLNAAVGYSSMGNLLSIRNGGRLHSSVLPSYIGFSGGANAGVVSGVDSLWDVGNVGLYVGYQGQSNLLQIVDGGTVTNVSAVYVGSAAASGSRNTLAVTNGGKLFSSGASSIANTAGQVSNTVLVSGSASSWTLGNANLTIGLNASTTGNVLRIEQGGTVDGINTLTVNPNNSLNLNGGTLGIRAATVNNGSVFTVGDGTQLATLKALGSGTCNFTNGLIVQAGGVLRGIGPVVGGSAVGVVLTNGATMSAGLSGPGTLALGNTTWYGGATNLVKFTDASGLPGSGYDVITISTQLTLVANGGKFVVRMDSLGGGANFQAGQNYLLKFMEFGASTTINPSDFAVDTSSFTPGGVWWVTNLGNALYLASTNMSPAVGGYTWNPAMSGNWSVNGNWMGLSAPPNGGHATNVLEFGGSGTASYSAANDLNENHRLKTLLLTSTSTGTNILRMQSLMFAGSGSGISLEGNGWTFSTNRIGWAEPFLLSGNGVNGGVILADTLQGTGAVTVATCGTYALAASNAFVGPVTVGCSGVGQLRVDNAWGLGSRNAVTVTNGTLRINVTPFKFGDVNQCGRQGTVAGANSIWTNKSAFFVGGAAGASNNSLTVTDQGRLLAASLSVGDGSSGFNSLIVSNGGQVVGNSSSMGTSSTNNTIQVTGTGSAFSSGLFAMAGEGSVLRIANGALMSNAVLQMAATSANSDVIITNGGAFSSGPGFTPSCIDGTSARCLVSGAGSLFNPGFGVYVGFAGGSNCELRVENRASATTVNPPGGYGYLVAVGGGTALSPLNRLILDNAYLNTYRFYLGYFAGSYGNTAVLTNGARLTMLHGAYGTGVGQAANANSNAVSIYNGSSYDGAGGYFQVGVGSLATGNRALVAGGSATNLSSVDVGFGSTNVANSLTVTNGGLVTLDGAAGLRIAAGAGSYGNWVLVSSGGVLNARANSPITIGAGAETWSNRMEVSTGGIVTNVGTLQVGNPTGQNQLFLTGGSLSVSNLVASNANNTIAFSSGMMTLRSAYVSNGVPFMVGDGTKSATLNLLTGGSQLFSDGLIVTNRATLTGSGSISGNTTVNGTNSPGAGVGTFTNIGNFTLTASSVSKIEIASDTTAETGWDLLAVTNGTLTLGGKLMPILTGGFTPTNTMSFVIMASDTPGINGSFLNTVAGRVNVYTNDLPTSVVGNFRVTISNDKYVVLDNFKPAVALGPVVKLR